jgi:hypothetical protein
MSAPDSSATTGTVIGRSTRKRRGRKTGVPYENATTGIKARAEIEKVLDRFDCKSIGFMKDPDEQHDLLLVFKHRGRQVQLRVLAKGWAQFWLKKNPWTYRHRCSKHEWEQKALEQGRVAINSVLRDWIKGQMTAFECGILSFEAVFMPFMLTSDGRSVIERVNELLPEPDEPKVVQIPHKPGA